MFILFKRLYFACLLLVLSRSNILLRDFMLHFLPIINALSYNLHV